MSRTGDSGDLTSLAPLGMSAPLSPLQPLSPRSQQQQAAMQFMQHQQLLHPSHSHVGMGGLGGMPRVPSVGAMPKVGSDGLEMEMELYNIFHMSASSFDTDGPGPEYFSHAFPTQNTSNNNSNTHHPSQLSSPPRPSSSASVSAAAAGGNFNSSIGRLQPTNNFNPWNSGSGAPAAASTPVISLQSNDAYMQSSPAPNNLPVNDLPAGSPAPISSPFLLNYSTPPVAAASGVGGVLTAEQQQRLYADFVAGKHLNSFSANPPTATATAPQQPLQFQPSLPKSGGAGGGGGASGMSNSDASDDSDDEDEAPPARKRGGRVKRELESTPASAHFNSPYYKPGAAGSDAALDAMGGDPNDKERLGKRLARKAELARASRRRKKMYVQVDQHTRHTTQLEDLESKVKKLGQKIEELQAKASSTRSQAPSHVLVDEDLQRKSAQQTIRATMSALLSQPEPPDAVANQRIQDLVRQFVENSRDRQSQVETYLDRVEESLTPGLQAKFAMWGLDQNDDFYTKPGLWTSLMSKEIGLAPNQLAAILAKRPAIHQERKNMVQCESMIAELRVKAGQHLRSLHQTMDEIQSVMSPTQLAKFYLWVENNEWTMQMAFPKGKSLMDPFGFNPATRR